MDEAWQLRLVDEGGSGVLHGDAAAPVRVEARLVAADPEPARTTPGAISRLPAPPMTMSRIRG
ncbi:hypothetical protein [Streptomyces xanthophaeus]|uniref:hypothetical protein n=1 Tax=Streptomyces xanthophaeus TaxID=67385 RepID=UPI0012FEC557|nr:hypothetical protein [Streptomyces xanthophaeus]